MSAPDELAARRAKTDADEAQAALIGTITAALIEYLPRIMPGLASEPERLLVSGAGLLRYIADDIEKEFGPRCSGGGK